jgi:triphosphoribosyl-dephospho-CoA synthase
MEGLPFYFEVFNQTDDVNIATVHTFLKILANHPDTLIARKSGEEMAQNVSERAATALELGGLETPEGREMLREMDKSLQQEDGKLNPGTSADLLVGVIFCALIFGLTF